MCGIVGYIGNQEACPILIEGLSKLEYRGYDSAGIAICNNNMIATKKYAGRLSVLSEHLSKEPLCGDLAIGHTRWATHGKPSNENSHPHLSNDNTIALVHNGIIENYLELKQQLIGEGYTFNSETDTEVIVHLIHKHYTGDLFLAVIEACKFLRGAYALAVICKDEPDKIIAVRKDSPLIIGLGSGENFIASDIPAVLDYTRNVYLLENDTYAVLTKDRVDLFDCEGASLQQEIYHVTWSADAASKAGYDHFMLKEIYEQPSAITNTLRGRIDPSTNEISLDEFNLTSEELASIQKIYIVACGTAYYAGCIGKNLIEKYARKSVETVIASEFRYSNPIIDEHTLFIAISQSGETADTLACMRLAKSQGARILAISNVVESSVVREADDVLYTWAGPEIAVASTKAYTTQVICMYLTALKMGQLSGMIEKVRADKMISAIQSLSDHADSVLKNDDRIRQLAAKFNNTHSMFYIGRGLDFCLALEGALKMKEISYIHAEAYPAGELKHGPIALIEPGSIVVALCTQTNEHFDKTISNIEEIKARGAYVIAITQSSMQNAVEVADEVLMIDTILDDAAVIPGVIILQLMAYYVSLSRGIDVDKPRNLAKSVTVE